MFIIIYNFCFNCCEKRCVNNFFLKINLFFSKTNFEFDIAVNILFVAKNIIFLNLNFKTILFDILFIIVLKLLFI